ncbi:MAG: hypothetical protein NVS3B18_10800 [Candidatus Dormibacteria bacterium]
MEVEGRQVALKFEAKASQRMAERLLGDHGTAVLFESWLGLAAVLERGLARPGGPEATVAEGNEVPT